MEAIKTLTRHVNPGAVVQGGAFRLDKGPTATELNTFRFAVTLVEECRKEGKNTGMCCIINDLALKPEERPKATGKHILPEEYLKLLQEARIPVETVAIFYESTLRNGAQHDAKRKGFAVVLKTNATTGSPVPICASIMGKFYTELAERGYSQQIGFYTREPKHEAGPDEKEDTACPLGPVLGARKDRSGYELQIKVLNYFVYPDGRWVVGGAFEPENTAV